MGNTTLVLFGSAFVVLEKPRQKKKVRAVFIFNAMTTAEICKSALTKIHADSQRR